LGYDGTPVSEPAKLNGMGGMLPDPSLPGVNVGPFKKYRVASFGLLGLAFQNSYQEVLRHRIRYDNAKKYSSFFKIPKTRKADLLTRTFHGNYTFRGVKFNTTYRRKLTAGLISSINPRKGFLLCHSFL